MIKSSQGLGAKNGISPSMFEGSSFTIVRGIHLCKRWLAIFVIGPSTRLLKNAERTGSP